MFCFVDNLSAGLRGERAGEFLLVLRVAGLDVVIDNGLNELALVGRQLLVESATVGQPLVVVRVGRIVVAGSAPVGFERLLDDLMAHECDVEPAARLVHGLGGVEVVVGYVEPVSGYICCHFRCRFVVYAAKIQLFFLINDNRSEKVIKLFNALPPPYYIYYSLQSSGKNPQVLTSYFVNLTAMVKRMFKKHGVFYFSL